MIVPKYVNMAEAAVWEYDGTQKTRATKRLSTVMNYEKLDSNRRVQPALIILSGPFTLLAEIFLNVLSLGAGRFKV